MRNLLFVAATCFALAGCQGDGFGPKLDAFLGTSDRCQQAETLYAGFKLVAGNKSTKQVEAFMEGVRAARDAGSDCKTFNLAQLTEAIAAGKAVLGVD